MTTPEQLANSHRAYLIAPAGFGKTHLIARAVMLAQSKPALVLTHTHAGVSALRGRIREFGGGHTHAMVTTIAGWAQAMTSAFPRMSGVDGAPSPQHVFFEEEEDESQTARVYEKAYESAVELLVRPAIRTLLRESYSGVYVDEYQDCTLNQSKVVLGLGEILPLRVIGDPMQAIFGFREEESVDMNGLPGFGFAELPQLSTPYRWKNPGANPALGEWLSVTRVALAQPDFDHSSIRLPPVVGKCLYSASYAKLGFQWIRKEIGPQENDRIAFLFSTPRIAESWASRQGGKVALTEAVEQKILRSYARKIDASKGLARAREVLGFVEKCATRFKSDFNTDDLMVRLKRSNPGKITGQRLELWESLRRVSELPGYEAIFELFCLLDRIKIRSFRKEALQEMVRALEVVVAGNVSSLYDAVELVRGRTRHIGRSLPRFVAGTPWLLKGLEFEHAVAFNVESFTRHKELYVALSRGSKSLTLVYDRIERKPNRPKLTTTAIPESSGPTLFTL